jgi:hypothetical protein
MLLRKRTVKDMKKKPFLSIQTCTPGNGLPTVPAFRTPLKGFDIAMTN